MSKSKGGILTVSVLEEKGYDPIAFRFMCLGSHYRKQLVFSYDALEQAQKTLTKLRNRVNNVVEEGELDSNKFDEYNNKFKKELENDLNTANALSVLYEVLKDNELNGKTKLELVNSFDKVFALELIKKEDVVDSDLEEYINKKIEERKEAKANKDYSLADSIRDELASKGIKLVDTKNGTTYELM
jgi:cysteinyl-tRNA synthetase